MLEEKQSEARGGACESQHKTSHNCDNLPETELNLGGTGPQLDPASFLPLKPKPQGSTQR